MNPVHEHDCDLCIFIGTYRLRHTRYEQYVDVPALITEGDLYLACDNSGYKYIVRYGIDGEYATTNSPHIYLLAPIVDGEDPNCEPPHTGHFSRLGGTWWCDTCDSPYCELA